MRPPRPAEGVLLGGLASVVAGVLLLVTGAPLQVGAVPTAPPAQDTTAALLTVALGAVGDAVVPPAGRVARVPAVGGPPVRLRLSPLGLSAAVVPVGVGAGGALGVPDDPAVVGWWSGGARPGSGRGSVVLDGHVDSARYGIGAFARLRQLKVGDRVEVSAGSRTLRYAVAGRRHYAKAELPASVFDQNVGERLVLITCGGRFNRRTARYSQNVVLYAVPVKDLG